jgi:hypothetical protein
VLFLWLFDVRSNVECYVCDFLSYIGFLIRCCIVSQYAGVVVVPAVTTLLLVLSENRNGSVLRRMLPIPYWRIFFDFIDGMVGIDGRAVLPP